MRCIICVNDHNPDFENVQYNNADDFANHVYTIHNDTPNMDYFREWFEQVNAQRITILDKINWFRLKAENHEKAREFNNAHACREQAKMLETLLLDV